MIDTGFNGYISVPKKIIKNSSWTAVGFETYELASGELIREEVFLGKIYFPKKEHITYVLANSSNDILIGTKLLQKTKLEIDFVSNKVKIYFA